MPPGVVSNRKPGPEPGTGQALLGKFVSCFNPTLSQCGHLRQVSHLCVRDVRPEDDPQGVGLEALNHLIQFVSEERVVHDLAIVSKRQYSCPVHLGQLLLGEASPVQVEERPIVPSESLSLRLNMGMYRRLAGEMESQLF